MVNGSYAHNQTVVKAIDDMCVNIINMLDDMRNLDTISEVRMFTNDSSGPSFGVYGKKDRLSEAVNTVSWSEVIGDKPASDLTGISRGFKTLESVMEINPKSISGIICRKVDNGFVAEITCLK